MGSDKKSIIDGLLGLVFGGAVVYLIYLAATKEAIDKFKPEGSQENIIFWVSLLLAPFLALVLHELGHLIAGLVQGFKLELFIVGFLGLRRENGTVKAFLNTDWQNFGGMAATTPSTMHPDLKKKYAIILLAGPIASLCFGALALVVFQLYDTHFNSFWAIFGLTSWCIFLATTVPNKSGIFFTDRKRFQ